MLLGSSGRYQEYFDAHPGVYYRSTGWLERGKTLEQPAQLRTGVGYALEELVRKYGEENGRYLFDEFNRYQQAYSQLTYIETGLEPGPEPIAEAAAEAADKGWSFERLPGDLDWLRRMVNGEWAEAEFVIAAPGQRIVPSYDAGVLKVRA